MNLQSANAESDPATPLYIGLEIGSGWSDKTHFRDLDCDSTSPAAYFGCGAGVDGRQLGAYGDFGSSTIFGLSLGYHPTNWLRTEIAVNHYASLDFSGYSNFNNVAYKQQPVNASGSATSLMLRLALYPAELMELNDLPVSPFVSVAAGVSRNRISRMNYRFPTLGEGSATITPSGDHTDLAWSLGIGVDVAVSEELTATLAYRRTDLGHMRTDKGPIRVIRPNVDLKIPVDSTEADLILDEITLSLRKSF